MVNGGRERAPNSRSNAEHFNLTITGLSRLKNKVSNAHSAWLLTVIISLHSNLHAGRRHLLHSTTQRREGKSNVILRRNWVQSSRRRYRNVLTNQNLCGNKNIVCDVSAVEAVLYVVWASVEAKRRRDEKVVRAINGRGLVKVHANNQSLNRFAVLRKGRRCAARRRAVRTVAHCKRLRRQWTAKRGDVERDVHRSRRNVKFKPRDARIRRESA